MCVFCGSRIAFLQVTDSLVNSKYYREMIISHRTLHSYMPLCIFRTFVYDRQRLRIAHCNFRFVMCFFFTFEHTKTSRIKNNVNLKIYKTLEWIHHVHSVFGKTAPSNDIDDVCCSRMLFGSFLCVLWRYSRCKMYYKRAAAAVTAFDGIRRRLQLCVWRTALEFH